jgi:hypothetical protein
VNDFIRTDQYVYVDRGCRVQADVHSVDDFAEVTLGGHRFSGSTLHLVVDDPDMLLRLSEAINEARTKLIEHLGTQRLTRIGADTTEET